MNSYELTKVVKNCWLEARLGAPHCYAQTDDTAPWWILKGDLYYWWEAPGGHLSIEGLVIPLTTRWVLCPAHFELLKAEGVSFDREG